MQWRDYAGDAAIKYLRKNVFQRKLFICVWNLLTCILYPILTDFIKLARKLARKDVILLELHNIHNYKLIYVDF